MFWMACDRDVRVLNKQQLLWGSLYLQTAGSPVSLVVLEIPLQVFLYSILYNFARFLQPNSVTRQFDPESVIVTISTEKLKGVSI